MYFTYLRRELRRRHRQALVVALGLAIGIGLVVTVSSAAAGVKKAQTQVLHSLYGVGTDMTVSKPASFGFGNSRFGGFHAHFGTRPRSGTHVARSTLHPSPGDATLSDASVKTVASVHGVAAASGGLQLTDTDFSGTIPSFGGGGRGSGSGFGRASFSVSSFTVDGIALGSRAIGPLNSSEVTQGRYFTSGENAARVAIVSAPYAKEHRLNLGSTVAVAGEKLSVIGLTSVTSANVFIPLGTAQHLSGLKGDVTTVYVSASSATSVGSVASAVRRAVPGSDVTTSATLAKEVSGSISTASNLASNLGRWLSIAVLVVAFLIAGLLMAAAVSRRVREIGTLKAIGWRSRRIVAQVMGEGAVLGLAGGAAGLVLGIAGAEIVSAVSPALSATIGSAFATGGGFFGGNGGGGGFAARRRGTGAFDSARTVLVHLTAPLQGDTIGLAIALALAGGLIAGSFGAWRAARLRPAAALRRIE